MKELLENEKIKPSKSSHSTQVLMAPKNTGSHGNEKCIMELNFCKLNKNAGPKTFILPDELDKAKNFTMY